MAFKILFFFSFLNFNFLVMLHSLWDLSFPTKDWILVPGLESWCLYPESGMFYSIFAHFFNVWLIRRQLDSLVCFWVQCVIYVSIHIIYVVLSHVRLCDPMDCSMPGFPVLHCLLEFAQTHVHWVSGQWTSSAALFSFCLCLSQDQGLFQWVGSSYQVAKVLELQLQYQSFQWLFRVDFL